MSLEMEEFPADMGTLHSCRGEEVATVGAGVARSEHSFVTWFDFNITGASIDSTVAAAPQGFLTGLFRVPDHGRLLFGGQRPHTSSGEPS